MEKATIPFLFMQVLNIAQSQAEPAMIGFLFLVAIPLTTLFFTMKVTATILFTALIQRRRFQFQAVHIQRRKAAEILSFTSVTGVPF